MENLDEFAVAKPRQVPNMHKKEKQGVHVHGIEYGCVVTGFGAYGGVVLANERPGAYDYEAAGRGGAQSNKRGRTRYRFHAAMLAHWHDGPPGRRRE